MDKHLFSVSIKGILQYNHKYLLRKNQRHEYELIGGRLDISDSSIAHRLRVEFWEESQILITDIKHREPWLYICGINNIIILPYTCSVYKNSVPEHIHDYDGGKIEWFQYDDLKSISLPIGYWNSISNTIPQKTYSSYVGKYPIIIPNYKESLFKVRINLYNIYYSKLFSEYLEHFYSPRELLQKYMKYDYSPYNIVAISPSYFEDTIDLNYVLILPSTKKQYS